METYTNVMIAQNKVQENDIFINKSMKNKLYKAYKNQVAVALGIPAAIGVWEIISFNNKNHAPTRLLQFLKLGIFSLSIMYVGLQRNELLRKYSYIDLNYPYPSKAQIEADNDYKKYHLDKLLKSEDLELVENAIKDFDYLDKIAKEELGYGLK